MSLREEYENLFLHLINKIGSDLRIDLTNDEVMNEYYLNGNIFSNNFDIHIGDDNSLSFTFFGNNHKYEELILSCLSEYQEVTPDVSYTIKDFEDKNANIKVYEWGIDKDKIKKIEANELLDYPRYITDIKGINIEESKRK